MTPEDRIATYLETGAWDPDWGPLSAEVAAIREQLADASTWEQPPSGAADVLAAIERDASAERDLASGTTATTAARTRWRRPAAWAAAAAAVVALVAAGVGLLVGGEDERPGETFELAGTELTPDATANGRVWSTGAGEWFELELDGLPPAAPGTYYQGWVHGTGGTVSIGTFHARDPQDAVHLWAGVAVELFPRVTVTVQRIGDAEPGPVVLEGRVAPSDEATSPGGQDDSGAEAAAR